MKILAIETSGVTFSVALSENGRLVSEVFWHSGLKHSEKLIPAVDKLLKKAGWKLKDLGKIAVSTGPGSFTGIRVGLSCARLLSQDIGIPLAGFDTLELLEKGVNARGLEVFAAIDALRGEVFARGSRTGKPEIEAAGDFIARVQKEKGQVCIAGSAALTYLSEFSTKLKGKAVFCQNEDNYPRAGVLALLAEKKKGAKYDRIKPLYIRRSWAEERVKSK